jgi:hypothetical protein
MTSYPERVPFTVTEIPPSESHHVPQSTVLDRWGYRVRFLLLILSFGLRVFEKRKNEEHIHTQLSKVRFAT